MVERWIEVIGAQMSTSESPQPTWGDYARLFIPKSVIALREGYGLSRLSADAFAGLTVAILALPLSMAIAIGCGLPPEKGLITSIVAGAIISALGGSRFQIGGPAAAFIVIIANVVEKHGYSALATTTFCAGVILVVAGLMKLGTYIKYIPGPVTIGFTSGIGALIALGQIKDFLGLKGMVAPEALQKLVDLWALRATLNPWALEIGLLTLVVIIACQRLFPRIPGVLVGVIAGSSTAWAFGLPVETIATRFGGLPTEIPAPSLPDLDPAKLVELAPSIFTIAFLIGIESLLSAVAADTMAGTRHRSNVEIVAQGAANMASPLFGGLPATGVIARTGTNITAGAQTPISGIFHSLFVLLCMVLLAPVASLLALPSLAAVLLHTAWRLLDVREVGRFLLRAPKDDRIILSATLGLTVLVDLSVAIAVGVVLASMLFMHRMSETPHVALGLDHAILDDVDDLTRPPPIIRPSDIPAGVRVFQFRGPLFFGTAAQIDRVLATLGDWPKVIILRMREVPLIDATAVTALEELAQTCAKRECRLIISGLQAQPRAALHGLGFLHENRVIMASNVFIAVEKAKDIVAAIEAARHPAPLPSRYD